MTSRAGRHPLAALRRAVSRTLSERRLPPYVGEYTRGRARVAAAAVGRWAGPVLRSPGRARAARKLRPLLEAGSERRLIRAAGGWRVAEAFEHESMASLPAEHRRMVAEALGAAGVAVGDSGDALVVDPRDRPAALAALRTAAARAADPLYVASGAEPVLLASSDATDAAHLAGAAAWSVYRWYWLSARYVVGEDQACSVRFDAGSDVASRRSDAATRWPAIDVVYTWVDGSDPRWQRAYEEARGSIQDESVHALAANASRFRNRDEIRYSLRSLALHAPWVRRVHLVTCGQVPAWLTADERIRVVRHDEILDTGCLPTFNSHAIESALHRVPGLAEHYLYLNDDFFLGRPVAPSLFFLPDGTPRCFPDEGAPIPEGPPTERDAPVDAAAKNVRDLISARFGVQPAAKMLHAPYAQRKSVLEDLERDFAEQFERTARSRFRAVEDLSVASCLAHHYALATGRAVVGTLESEYVNVADRWAPIKMERLLSLRACDSFCLNETDLPPGKERRVQRAVASFLGEYFPRTGPFEITRAGPGAA
ncbi:MAG: stealth family protein [Acidimicrobiia bacterium]|nr:stealth family protein [Acidimicrobiia bacterium]